MSSAMSPVQPRRQLRPARAKCFVTKGQTQLRNKTAALALIAKKVATKAGAAAAYSWRDDCECDWYVCGGVYG